MKFCYVIQAEASLPKNYECIRSNVILVSWKTKTHDTTIFLPNSTWTTGRNAGYSYIKEQGLVFDYVIFLDDDLQFEDISHKEGF